MKASKNLRDKLNISTGKVEQSEPSTLDQLFGLDAGNKFGTLDPKIYQAKLNGLNLGELQEEAKRVSLPPIDDKERLKRALFNEFRVYVSNYRVPKSPKPVDPKKVDPAVLEFMKEGK